MGLDFVAFWLFGGLLLGPPTSCQKWFVFPISHTKNLAAPGPAPFSNFWPFGPSFPCILALWALISFHFRFVGLDFLAFWPCGPSFPFIFALWALPSLHFGSLGGQLLGSLPPTSCQKRSVFPISHTKTIAAPGPAPITNFWPFGPSFAFILALWAFISFYFGLVGLYCFCIDWPVGLHFLAFWQFGPSLPFILAFGLPYRLPFYFLSVRRGLGAQGVASPPQTPTGKSCPGPKYVSLHVSACLCHITPYKKIGHISFCCAKLTYHCLNLRFKFDFFAAKISSPSCAYVRPKRDTDATR